MRLLFDENLSHQLVRPLGDLFPQSVHVRDAGLRSADDPDVWQYAKDSHLIIVSKDSDLHQRSFVLGHPPKLVWVRLGNCSTAEVKNCCADFSAIAIFHEDPETSFLALSWPALSKE